MLTNIFINSSFCFNKYNYKKITLLFEALFDKF